MFLSSKATPELHVCLLLHLSVLSPSQNCTINSASKPSFSTLETSCLVSVAKVLLLNSFMGELLFLANIFSRVLCKEYECGCYKYLTCKEFVSWMALKSFMILRKMYDIRGISEDTIHSLVWILEYSNKQY